MAYPILSPANSQGACEPMHILSEKLCSNISLMNCLLLGAEVCHMFILLNYCQQYLWDRFYHLFPPSYSHTFLSNLLVFSNLTALHIVPAHDIISKVNLQVKENLTNIILFDQKAKWYMTFFYPNYSKYLIMLGIFISSREMQHVFPWIYQ